MAAPTTMNPYVKTGTAVSETVVARYIHLWMAGVKSSIPSSSHITGSMMPRNLDASEIRFVSGTFRFSWTLTKPSSGTPRSCQQQLSSRLRRDFADAAAATPTDDGRAGERRPSTSMLRIVGRASCNRFAPPSARTGKHLRLES